MQNAPLIPMTVRRLGEDMGIDLAALYQQPLHQCGHYCWLTPRKQFAVNGETVNIRYFLYEWVTGQKIPRDQSLVSKPTCGLRDCVNPLHQILLPYARKGRKPADTAPPVTGNRERVTQQIGIKGPDNWIDLLLLLPLSSWSPEARNVCWIWTGYLRHIPAKPQPRPVPTIGNRTAMQVIWEKFNGKPVPDGKKVTRICRNPMCVSPAHMVLANGKLRPQDAHLTPTPEPIPMAAGDEAEDRELLLDLVNTSFPDKPPEVWLPAFTWTLLQWFTPGYVKDILRDLAKSDRQYAQLLEHVGWN